MHDEKVSKMKYCNTSASSMARANSQENLLCEKCNKYQERKMEELNKFEPKDEVKL